MAQFNVEPNTTAVNIIVVAAALTGAFFLGRGTKHCPVPEVRIDTLVRVDTLRDTVLVERERYVTRVERVPFRVDSIVHDTVFVDIPIERVEYRDTNYYAVVEGYRARLAFIETYNRTQIIMRDILHETYIKPRWGLGVQVGYGTDFQRFRPYLGVGVQYNLITW